MHKELPFDALQAAIPQFAIPTSDAGAMRRRRGWPIMPGPGTKAGALGLILSMGAASEAVAQILGDGPVAARPAEDDTRLTPDERARRALDAANTLDIEAQQARSTDAARAAWLKAATLLDDSLKKDPGVATAAALRFQAAVYLWARARSRLDEVELLPATDPGRAEVATGLDDAAARLRAVPVEKDEDQFAENVRFRLAQAIADRARLRPEGDPARAAAETEALGLVARPAGSPRLRPFARLLHAELATRLGQFGPAQVEIEAVEKLDPPAPPVAVAEAKLAALAGRGLFDEADRVVDRASAPAERKTLWRLRIALARRRALSAGRERDAVDAGAIALAGTARAADRPESRRALMELARAVDLPPSNSPPSSYDLLAEGQLLLLDPGRAARLALRGADLAGPVDPAGAAALRFKAGAAQFRAEDFDAADLSLGRVAADPKAPRPLRARSGMLRALALGRALAAKKPGATRAAYLEALEAQVRDFADAPASGEARWLLGKIRLAANRRDEAVALWAGVAPGQPRWIDAQAAAADVAIEAVEDQWINRDAAAARPRLEAARAMIRAALDRAREGDESVALGLRLARLETIPGLGRPERRGRRARPPPPRARRRRFAPPGPAGPDGGAGRAEPVRRGRGDRPRGRPRRGARSAPARRPRARPARGADRGGLVPPPRRRPAPDAPRSLGRPDRPDARGRPRRGPPPPRPGPALHRPTPPGRGGPSRAGAVRPVVPTTRRCSATWPTPTSASKPTRWPSTPSGSGPRSSRPARPPGSTPATAWPWPCTARAAPTRRVGSSRGRRSSTPTSAAARPAPGSNGSARSSTPARAHRGPRDRKSQSQSPMRFAIPRSAMIGATNRQFWSTQVIPLPDWLGNLGVR